VRFPTFSLTDEEIAIREHESKTHEIAKEAQKTQSLMIASGLPEKQTQAITPFGSEWIRLEDRLKGKIGSGFIIALSGCRGTGKTRLAASCIRESARHHRSSSYKTTMEFFLDIKASFKDPKKSEKDVIAEYAKPKLLVLDEVQERGETPWEDRLLTHLIDRRYAEEKDTLLITNQTKEAFLLSMGESVRSRIEEMGGIAVCNWPSYRAKSTVKNN